MQPPGPVGVAIEPVRDRADLDLAGIVSVEPGLAEQRAGEHERRIDGGELDVFEPRAGLHVEEVVEKSVRARGCRRSGAAKKRRVVRTRSRAASRVTHPRSTAMGYAVRPKPTAAMLEKDGEGARSGTRPFFGFERPQK